MVKIEAKPGQRYLYRERPVCIRYTLDLHLVLGEYEATGESVRIPIADLRPLDESAGPPELRDDIFSIPEKAWAKAEYRFAVLEKVSKDKKVGRSTIYRWLKLYDETGSVRSLVDLPRPGGKNKSRLGEDRNRTIEEAITSHYLTRQKKQASEVVEEVRRLCRAKELKVPTEKTVRRRIQQLDEEETTRRRLGNKAAEDRYRLHQGELPDGKYPLQLVELDHTIVDIILVDEIYRKPLSKPYLTMAIDTYSRMVVGIHLSYDPPGAIGTGLCIAHMLLPKEAWLAKVGVEGDWPCCGVPAVLHLDNAREFRGNMMLRACEKYNIRLEYRPVRTPRYGAHIERMMGHTMRKVHTLPGTTFSNPEQRGEYDSEKMAALTLQEFEQWLTTYITGVYHKRLHSKTNQTPYARFRAGILGTHDQPGIGLPERYYDERQVRLDFMPAIERSVQQYGVQVDHIYYYADVLRSYINRRIPGSDKNRGKQMLTFKRDPRDLSVLYLLEPGTNLYHRIPYRNTSRPSISIWEHRAAIRQLKQQGVEQVDEDSIFAALDRMRAQVLASVAKTQSMTPKALRILKGVPVEELFRQTKAELPDSVTSALEPAESLGQPEAATPSWSIATLQPFDDAGFYAL
jgi:putative transposase